MTDQVVGVTVWSAPGDGHSLLSDLQDLPADGVAAPGPTLDIDDQAGRIALVVVQGLVPEIERMAKRYPHAYVNVSMVPS